MTSGIGHPQNANQVAYWNGPGGQHWAKRQHAQDAMLAPISAILIDRSEVKPGERIVDIGCGCGATTIAVAAKVGPTGHVLGIDISEPMLARARELAPKDAPVDFALADATVHQFKGASADLVISRFGVMFFADPERSFENIRTAVRSGGRLAFVCWREPRENPWMMVPLQAAYQHVPKLPPLGPEDPGPFAFASKERVDRILRHAGFTNVAIHPHDLSLDLAIGNGLDAAVDAALEMGPASRALEGQPPDAVAAATASIRKALLPFAKGASVLLPAAIWIVTALEP
ncbi:methyltransferase domain-containing protein [Rhodopseudomonas palustris]|nr:methyltransferase domain-containing protein [Rhodopseudomonas palustris]